MLFWMINLLKNKCVTIAEMYEIRVWHSISFDIVVFGIIYEFHLIVSVQMLEEKFNFSFN